MKKKRPVAFLVQQRMCAACIYRPESRLDLVKLENDVRDPYVGFKGHRVCHHSRDVCCRGFWERHKDEFPAGQIAQRLGPVAGFRRTEVVELARLGAKVRWANRVLLRLWREVCAPSWPCWPVRAAVSYSVNALHSGNLYRFDGWEKVREDCGSGGGGTYSTRRLPGTSLHGRKTLWVYRYG